MIEKISKFKQKTKIQEEQVKEHIYAYYSSKFAVIYILLHLPEYIPVSVCRHGWSWIHSHW
jgi:hypothetical protein